MDPVLSFFDHLSTYMWIFLDHLPTSSHWMSQKANDILRESLRIDKLKSKRLCIPWDLTQVLTKVVSVCENLTFIHLPFKLNKLYSQRVMWFKSQFFKNGDHPTLRYLLKEHACWRVLGKFSTLHAKLFLYVFTLLTYNTSFLFDRYLRVCPFF